MESLVTQTSTELQQIAAVSKNKVQRTPQL